MKNNFFKLALFLVAALMVTFVSCKDDDPDDTDDPTTTIYEDGIYLVGASTPFTEISVSGLFKNTRNEVLNGSTTDVRASLYEMYVPVKAGEGFQIAIVSGGTPTYYGPGSDYALIENPTNDEPKEAFKRGTLEANSTKFTVDADAMYHVVFDKELMKVAVAKVSYWGVLGAATPGGWTTDTELAPKSFDLTEMVFEATDIRMGKGEMKFRYSKGWKLELDTVLDLGEGNKGVKVNTNYGGAVDALVAGGDNISFSAIGYYTIQMTWKAGAWTATMTKTGDVEVIDYTSYDMGIIGSCYIDPVTGEQGTWANDLVHMLPAVDGTTYTWDFGSVDFIVGEFKLRQDAGWDGKSVGYSDCVWTGNAASNFSDNGGNIAVSTDGTYNLVFTIDAATETYTMEVTQ